jgi:hypothetical protein
MNTQLEAMNARAFWERLFTHALNSLSDAELIRCAEDFSKGKGCACACLLEVFPQYIRLAIVGAGEENETTPKVSGNVVSILVAESWHKT